MCTSPVPLGDKFVPCGRCLDCLRQYQQDWTIRISEEAKAYAPGSVIFFTLTYADEMLPYMVSDFSSCGLLNFIIRGKQLDSVQNFYEQRGLSSFVFTRSLKDTDQRFLDERKCFCDSFLDNDNRSVLFTPSVSYDDVNQWIRYCRKYFDRHTEPVKVRDDGIGKRLLVSPYIVDLQNENGYYPDSAYSKSFKYFITSEYGPSTLRSHYHGVLFGVPEDMFRDVFMPYWREHFGAGSKVSVDYSVFEPDKGGAMYIAKYCSKGSFEHPLCSRDFFYPSGKEYHSKHYEKCLQWFDVDAPLCSPTFHLISKGIGIRAAFSPARQRYFESECKYPGFFCRDIEMHSIPFSELVNATPAGWVDSSKLFEREPLNFAFNRKSVIAGTFFDLVRYADKKKKPVGVSSFVVHEESPDYLSFSDRLYAKRFVRVYMHNGSLKTYDSLVPRYYRRYLLSPLAQFAIMQTSTRLRNDAFARERRQARLARRQNQTDAYISQKWYSEALQRKVSAEKIRCRYDKFYSRPFKVDYGTV